MTRALHLLALAICLVASLPALAQVPNEGLANAVVAARQKNAALLAQYNWNCRTDVEKDGSTQDLRINLVSLAPDGTLQKTLLNDQPGKLPGGFFRKMIAEDKRKEAEQYIKGLVALVDQYTLPGAGKVASFIVQAQVQPVTTPDGKTVLQITGNSVVVPGDTFTLTLDGTKLTPLSIQITTTFNGDQVTLSGSYHTNQAGLNHLQYGTAAVPDKGLTVNIHNYDYVSNN